MTPKQSKSQIKAAQAKHLADLFGDESVPAASGQQAQDQRSARGQQLSQAAQAKQRQLSDDEAAKLAELQQRQAEAKTAAKEPVQPTPGPTTRDEAPATPSAGSAPAPSDLEALSARNDLADAALRNMKQHARQAPPPARPQTAPTPEPAPAPRSQPADAPASDEPARAPDAPVPSVQGAPAHPPKRRPAPSPEELDRLLRAMAARNRRDRPAPGTQPAPVSGRGAEAAPDAAPQMEAPPDVPDEAPERNQEKQAEIIEKLRAQEAQATRQEPHIPQPQSDQQRATAKPVEVKVPIVTEDNAVSAAPLHQALEDLAKEMGAKNAPGQVEGINKVHQQMPGHPLRDQAEGDSRG